MAWYARNGYWVAAALFLTAFIVDLFTDGFSVSPLVGAVCFGLLGVVALRERRKQ